MATRATVDMSPECCCWVVVALDDPDLIITVFRRRATMKVDYDSEATFASLRIRRVPLSEEGDYVEELGDGIVHRLVSRRSP